LREDAKAVACEMEHSVTETAEASHRPAILVATPSGGVGKTTTAAVLCGMGAAGRAICVDRTTREGASRLAQLIKPGEVEDIPVSPKIDRAESAQDIQKFWIPFDILRSLIRDGDCVIDFGANVIQFFCDWASEYADTPQPLGGEGPGIVLVIPTTANARALRDVRETCDLFGQARIQVQSIVVVFNELMGSVEAIGGPDLAWIRGMQEEGYLQIVRMPRVSGFAMTTVETGKASFMALPFVSAARFAQFASLDEMRAAHSVLQFSYFAAATVDSLIDAGIEEGPSIFNWTRLGLVQALERTQQQYTRFATMRQTDILEKVRGAMGDRTGVGLSEVLARISAFERTMLIELFPELFVRLQEEFIDAAVEERLPDARAVARGFEGLRLAGERRRRRVDTEIRGGLHRADLHKAVRAAAQGFHPADPHARRIQRMEEIRGAYGDIWAIPIVLFLWAFRRL